MADYDLIIIGSGPGGYVAAVRATQLGLKTVCIEKEERLGGVCLNVGCIPSKALLDSSEYYHLAQNDLKEHGVTFSKLGLDIAAMMERKETVVAELTHNVRRLLEHHNIEILRGAARIEAPGSVVVENSDKKIQSVKAPHILLATGSTPVEIPSMAFDNKHIVSSTGALKFDSVPEHLGIVGGGYIGLELGSVWRRLGAKVTVIEMLPKIGTTLDGQVARTLDRILRKQGFDFRLNTQVKDAKVNKGKVDVAVAGKAGEEVLSFDRLLVSVGRRPVTQGLGLEALGVETDAKTGHVQVDETYQTSIGGIYAIGDLVPGPMLAHKASAEGIAAVESIAGHFGEVNYDTIPSVIYTAPEVACVGMTEDQLKAQQVPYCKGTYPFTGAGRARCMGQTDGFVKLLAHSKTDRVLGVHIIGARAAEMISEAVLAMEFGASSEDIARTVHGHPTFAEALQEAAMQVRQCSIYAS